jgi:hypothetical protein
MCVNYLCFSVLTSDVQGYMLLELCFGSGQRRNSLCVPNKYKHNTYHTKYKYFTVNGSVFA